MLYTTPFCKSGREPLKSTLPPTVAVFKEILLAGVVLTVGNGKTVISRFCAELCPHALYAFTLIVPELLSAVMLFEVL